MTRFRLKSVAIAAFGLACVAMTDGAARLRTSGDTHPAEDLVARKGSDRKRSATPGECESDIEDAVEKMYSWF